MSQYVGQHFSKLYGRLRPIISDNVVRKVTEFLAQKIPLSECSCVVDAACGTGLATAKFADQWPVRVQHLKFIGIDISDSQILEAKRTNARANIEYFVGDVATGFNVSPSHVDLITVVQAAHYIDLAPFFTECHRALKPGGVIAIVSYGVPQIQLIGATGELNMRLTGMVRQLNDDLDSENYFYPSRRKDLICEHTNIELPFSEQVTYRDDESLFYRKETSLGEFKNFLDTWSAIRKYRKREPDGPLLSNFYENFVSQLPEDIGSKSALIQIFPWFVIMCRKPS